MIRAGIIGGAGYTAGELIRLLLHHPGAEIAFVTSASHAGQPVAAVHRDLTGDTDLRFSDVPGAADVLFLCGGHGTARPFVAALPTGLREAALIDLGNDFRLAADAGDFVYGLPEAFRDRIAGARHIANPGCFATAIQLALLPLAAADRLAPDIHVTGITGATGAGQRPSETTHFSWRSDNLSVYKPFTHQHVAEIEETLRALAPSYAGGLHFIPVRGCFARGILVSVHLRCDCSEDAAGDLYRTFYRDAPFVTVTDAAPDLKMAVNTNRCFLHVEKHGAYLHITGVLDNLLKGASGQAVQNMNLLTGMPETAGLLLKPSAF